MCNICKNMARIRRFLLMFLLINVVSCHESAQYLQSAVRDLRKLNSRQTLRRADTAMVPATVPTAAAPQVEAPVQPPVERRVRHGDEVPPLSLTKGELSALYENAVTKGETLKLDTGDNSYIHAAVHELDSSDNQESHTYDSPKNSADSSDADASGYYYYYYPIKSFLDEMSSQPSGSSNDYTYKSPKPQEVPSTHKPQYQYHSHHHQHNITINKAVMEDKKSKSLEPLFMAISGFIGMAVMFVLSVLVLPKFGIKPKTRVLGKKNEKIEDFARLAMDAIDGGDCAERFACELSKTARAFNLQENRFVKLLKRIAPGTFGKHIDRVGKYTNRIKCTAIPCKKKNNNNNNNNSQKKKNAQKKH